MTSDQTTEFDFHHADFSALTPRRNRLDRYQKALRKGKGETMRWSPLARWSRVVRGGSLVALTVSTAVATATPVALTAQAARPIAFAVADGDSIELPVSHSTSCSRGIRIYGVSFLSGASNLATEELPALLVAPERSISFSFEFSSDPDTVWVTPVVDGERVGLLPSPFLAPRPEGEYNYFVTARWETDEQGNQLCQNYDREKVWAFRLIVE